MARATIHPIARKLRPERLGHEVIDSDHIEISDCWFQAVNCTPIQFPFLIARMKSLMKKHFAREGAMMERASGALCACHQRDHDDLIGLCDRAAWLSKYDPRKGRSLLRYEFPKRVREHIICMDQMVVLFINTNGAIVQAGSCHFKN
jgi:hemerythrin